MSSVPKGAEVANWLRSESRLPGPRANLEVLRLFVSEAGEEEIAACLAVLAPKLPPDSPDEFVAMCGVAAVGRQYAETSNPEYAQVIRKAASHSSWRVREAAAMAVQEIGGKDPSSAIAFCTAWEKTTHLEKRCIAAGLCDPALLTSPEIATTVLDVLDEILIEVDAAKDIKSEDFKTLKKGLSYCLSVAVAAIPEEGKQHFEEWMQYDSTEIKTILLENLKKDRLVKMDREWVAQQIEFLSTED